MSNNIENILSYTQQEADDLINELSCVFKYARILPGDLVGANYGKDENLTLKNPCPCYSFWKKDKPCKNCTSGLALKKHCQLVKIEFLENKIYQVISKYIIVDGKECVLELINPVDDGTFVDMQGKEKLIKLLTNYNDELFIDSLTKAYNRRYWDDVMKVKSGHYGIAMIDIDNFKVINDTYGHSAGDITLVTLVNAISSSIRKTDTLIRYGGDEFILIMPDISATVFAQKLNQIRDVISQTIVPGYIRIQIQVSIGGLVANDVLEKLLPLADSYMYTAKNGVGLVTALDTKEIKESKPVEKFKIIIADNNHDNVEQLNKILCDKFEVYCAYDGRECYNILKDIGSAISLMILNLDLSKLSGFEILKQLFINNLQDDIPVIMINDGNVDMDEAIQWGITDSIDYPFNDVIVLQRVSNTLKLFAKQRRLSNIIGQERNLSEKNNEILINLLSIILEDNKQEDSVHMQHVYNITKIIIADLIEHDNKYNLNKDDYYYISNAAALHDIGKLGMDNKLFTKEDLSDTEKKTLQSHTVIGARMVNGLKVYKDEPLVNYLYQITRWHHERYDGSGYPDKLFGDKIPIAAQVVGLADYYDSLVYKHTHRKLSHQQAVQIIVQDEKNAFNPVLINSIIRCSKSIEDYMNGKDGESLPIK